MQITATLVNLKGQHVTLQCFDLPAGRTKPPYHLNRDGRIFLIDPMHWHPGTETTPIIARYVEEEPHDNMNVDNIAVVKTQQVAA